jgi:hypothetical protein
MGCLADLMDEMVVLMQEIRMLVGHQRRPKMMRRE